MTGAAKRRIWVTQKIHMGRNTFAASCLHAALHLLLDDVINRYQYLHTDQDDNKPLQEIRLPVLQDLLKKPDVVLPISTKYTARQRHTTIKSNFHIHHQPYLNKFQLEVKVSKSLGQLIFISKVFPDLSIVCVFPRYV